MAVHEENFQVHPEALAPGTEVSGWRIRKLRLAGLQAVGGHDLSNLLPLANPTW